MAYFFVDSNPVEYACPEQRLLTSRVMQALISIHRGLPIPLPELNAEALFHQGQGPNCASHQMQLQKAQITWGLAGDQSPAKGRTPRSGLAPFEL